MAYSLDQLISQFRVQMDDNAQPYLWDEDRIVEWIDEAQKVFAERTRIFKGKENIAALVASDGEVVIPAYVTEIRKAKYVGSALPLELLNFNDVERGALYSDYGLELTGDWEDLTGTPRGLIKDYATGVGRLVPKPTADGSVDIFYYRLPLRDVTSSSSKLELTDTRHQRLMVVYARAMAYGDHDADVYDPKQEAAKLTEFSAKTEEYAAQISRQTRNAGTVKYGGY